jgi:uncharacterized protein
MNERREGLRRPAWRVALLSDTGEQDITANISPRLVSLTLNDERGIESDDVQIELDDADNLLEIPPTGARLSVSIGWHGQPLVHKGIYTVDEPDYSSPPRRLRLTARAADVSGSLGEKRDRSWHDVDLRSVAASIAEQHGLTLRISDVVADAKVAHIDQTGESDISFMSRLALEYYDAICTVKSGYLLLTPAATCVATSGLELPSFALTESKCSTWRWQAPKRDRKTSVRAHWHDIESGQRRSVTVGLDDGDRQVLRTTYPSEDAARQAALAELKRLSRGGELHATLALGAAELIPEVPVSAVGFKQQIDAVAWVAKKVSHSLNANGFITSVELEPRDNET